MEFLLLALLMVGDGAWAKLRFPTALWKPQVVRFAQDDSWVRSFDTDWMAILPEGSDFTRLAVKLLP
jgi:hypothetical protein